MTRSGARPRRALATALVTAALFTSLPILDIVTGGARRVIAYFAADGFYYLTVARNIVRFGFPTFDHERATNGFHPLWQLVLTGMYAPARALGISDLSFMAIEVVVVTLLVAAAIGLIALAFARADGGLTPLYVVVPAGVFGIVISPLWLAIGDALPEMNPFEGSAPVWGTLFYAVNGMETGLLLFSWAVMCALTVCKPVTSDVRWGAALGAAMAAVTLSRLDHAFFAVFLGIALLPAFGKGLSAAGANRGLPGIGLVACACVAAVPIALYLLSNLVYFGSPVPISGSLKSTFPHPTADNLSNIIELLGPQLPGWWLERATRELQIVVPALAAIAALFTIPVPRGVRLIDDPASRRDAVMRASAWAILVLGGYNFFFVPWVHQGHWYYPLSTLFVSLLAVRALARWAPARWIEQHRVAHGTTLALGAAFTITFFLTLHRHDDYHAHYADFLLEDAERVRERLAGQSPRFVEFDDGVIAWGTGFPSIPASGLTLDPEGARRVHHHQLFPLASERGHRFFASSITPVGNVHYNVQSNHPGERVNIVYRSDRGFFGVVELAAP